MTGRESFHEAVSGLLKTLKPELKTLGVAVDAPIPQPECGGGHHPDQGEPIEPPASGEVVGGATPAFAPVQLRRRNLAAGRGAVAAGRWPAGADGEPVSENGTHPTE
jgi:hypothetical protein